VDTSGTGCPKERVNEVDIFCILYENRKMKPVGIVLRRKEEQRENDRGDKPKIYCKHICEYHSVSPCTTIIC
jgi:hypothetical protein